MEIFRVSIVFFFLFRIKFGDKATVNPKAKVYRASLHNRLSVDALKNSVRLWSMTVIKIYQATSQNNAAFIFRKVFERQGHALCAPCAVAAL